MRNNIQAKRRWIVQSIWVTPKSKYLYKISGNLWTIERLHILIKHKIAAGLNKLKAGNNFIIQHIWQVQPPLDYWSKLKSTLSWFWNKVNIIPLTEGGSILKQCYLLLVSKSSDQTFSMLQKKNQRWWETIKDWKKTQTWGAGTLLDKSFIKSLAFTII